MAESNATQVILTDDGIKIINAQNTADNAASGVANLNDPNLMSVIEKQTQDSQYAGLTSQYNVVLAQAKDASISTTALTTAYTNLNTFMTAILTDTTKASDVNRDTYKSLTDAYNTALSNVQNALKDAYNTDIDNMQSSVSVASQAASSAAIVASQATTTGNNASQVASQAASAANQASADYTALSAGVKDGSVINITTKTAIKEGVIGTAEIADAAITDAKMGNISANHLTAGTIDASKVTVANLDAGNITTGTLSTDRLNVGKLSALSADLGTVTAGNINGLDIVAKTFSTANGTFTADSNGNITASSIYLVGNKNLVYNSELLGNAAGWSLNNAAYLTTTAAHDGTATLGMNNTALQNTWNTMATSKQMTIMSSTANSNISLSGWMFVGSLATGTTTACMVVELLDSSGNRVSANFARADLSKLGQWQRVTVSGGTIPSGAVKVRVLYQIYGPGGNIYWSQPMISNSSNWQGYTSDTGNVVSAGEIDGSVINGSTINGTTFHGGDIISNANNTAKYYPMTITPDGAYKSTYFDSAVGL
ncbi:phage tail protein, partial [Lactiplantibacillus plantarum]